MMARTLTEWHENKLRCLLNSSFSAVRDRELVKKLTKLGWQVLCAGRFGAIEGTDSSRKRFSATDKDSFWVTY